MVIEPARHFRHNRETAAALECYYLARN